MSVSGTPRSEYSHYTRTYLARDIGHPQQFEMELEISDLTSSSLAKLSSSKRNDATSSKMVLLSSMLHPEQSTHACPSNASNGNPVVALGPKGPKADGDGKQLAYDYRNPYRFESH